MVRFRLFGIPFEVGLYFWIGSALLGSSGAHGEHALALLAVWVACVFVSIVVHELGHALMARRFGITPHVTLNLFGGMTYMPGSGLTRPQGMLVTLAGPAAGFFLWALTRYFFVGLLVGTEDVSYLIIHAIKYLLFINLIWTLFNLLPILPLDGGQFVRNLVGPRHLFLARMIGGTVAVAACAWCLRINQVYAGIFLGLLAISNFRPPVARPQ